MKAEKVAVVTGAARGIGQAICEQLLEDGFHVVGLDISPVEWSQSAQLSNYQVNLCDAAAVSEVVDSIVEQHGRIDALVNNAGITRDALLPDMLEQDWDSVIDVNLKAVVLAHSTRRACDARAGHRQYCQHLFYCGYGWQHRPE